MHDENLGKKINAKLFCQLCWKGKQIVRTLPNLNFDSRYEEFHFLPPSVKIFISTLGCSDVPPPQPKSCPSLSGDARAEDVKLILGYTINPISDCSVFSFLLQHLLSRTASSSSFSLQLQLIWSQLSSNALSILRVVLCPQVITYQVWSL